VFDEISGLVIGRFHPKVGFGENHRLLKEIVLRTTEGFHFPIVFNADFGHTNPMITLPNGIQAKLQASFEQGVLWQLTEAAVRNE
jgi:muramoyltetrapeptide carboxypeptidase